MDRLLIKLLAVCVLLGVFPSSTLAQQGTSEAPAKRWLWDMRPNKCFMSAEALTFPMCKPEPNWPDFQTTQRRVGDLFADPITNDPNYELIQKAEDELGYSRESFSGGGYLSDAWLSGLEMRFNNYNQFSAKIAKNWVKARGSDGYAKLAEALLQMAQAWSARGGGYSSTVTPEAWGLYYGKLDEADATLDSASPRLKQTGPWHVLKLEIAFQNPRLEAARLELLRAASDAWPAYVRIYSVPMHYASPLWGGSFEVMEETARFAAEQSKKEMGDAMYVILYERSFRGASTYTLRDSEVDWERMKRGFREIQARRGNLVQPWLWKNFAALACQMRDRNEARRLYDLHDSLRSTDPEEGIDPCRHFAIGKP